MRNLFSSTGSLARLPGSLLVIGSVAACGSEASDSSVAMPVLTPVIAPAPVGSSSPALVSSNGQTFLSWQERQADSSLVLRYAEHSAGAWSAVAEVPTGGQMIESTSDVPMVGALASGARVAIWRGRHSKQGYDIYLAHSPDSGQTWSIPERPHHDGTDMEHGFVSLVQLGDSSGMVWVDGRNNADADTAANATQLALAAFSAVGAPLPESFIDTKICDCCHTSSALAAGGSTVIAYRDRKDGEIRDISVARWTNGGWRLPVTVHEDNWRINGCPVNGPSIAASGADVAVAWYTAADDTPRVQLAFSADTASTFAAPVQIHEGRPDGKVGLVLLPSGDAVVSWIERRGEEAVLRVRRVTRDGARSPAVDVAALGTAKRAGGMPKLVRVGDAAWLTWTDPVGNQVRVMQVS